VADSVPVFALTLGLAYRLPLERRSDPTGARRLLVLDRSESGPGALEAPREGRTPAVRRTFWARRASVAVVVVYALSAMITSFRIAGLAEVYSAKEWFATVRSQLALHPTASIFDSYLPAGVFPAAYFGEDAKASRALAPIARHVRWDAPAEHPLIFDPTGHLRPVEVGHATTAAPGPVSGCGYLVGRKPVVAPLQQRLFAWEWGSP